MNIQLLLEEMHGQEPLKGLDNFVAAIEKNENVDEIIKSFLEKSQKCDEILQLLTKRKCTPAELSKVFNSLGYILMRIANSLSSYQSVGIHITRWTLQNHVHHLSSLLSISNTAKNITSALHCITGMVLTGNASANEVMSHLNFNHINFKALAERSDNLNNTNIRTWLFNLILAILNSRDVRCIRLLLQVEGSVSSIFLGLEGDPPDKVIKLLNLLNEVVVLDMSISKTLKVKLFNSSSCGHLMKLYGVQDNSVCADEDVVKSIHQLMITLCSDIKHGVIFKEKSDTLNASIRSNNMHVLQILKSGKSIWGTDKGRELVSSTLRACPDIIKLFMQPYQNLELKATDHFYSLNELFSVIINACEPWNSLCNRQKMKNVQKNISFFIPNITNKLLIELMGSSSDLLLHCGFLLLNSLYAKVTETLSRINAIEDLCDEEKVDYRKTILKNAESFGGGRNQIFTSWNKFFSGDLRNNAKLYPFYIRTHPTQFALLSLIVDVYHQYGELFGYSLLHIKINPFTMLENIYSFPNTTIETDNENYLTLLLKVLNFLLLAQKCNDFELFGYKKDACIDTEVIILNKQWFMLLLKVYCCPKSQKENDCLLKIRNICSNILNAALECWGLASYCPINMHLWLQKLDGCNKDNCCTFLIDAIINTVSNLFAYLEVLLTVKTAANESCLESGFDMLTEVKRASQSLNFDNEDVYTNLDIPFSCLIVGATEILKQKSDDEALEYFSSVMCDYINLLDHPKLLAKYLVSNKVLSCNTEVYFNALLGCCPTNSDIIDKDNINSLLKGIFISKRYPKASEFWASFKNLVNTETEQLSIISQLILYMQVDNESTAEEKKKNRFYWKLLRLLLSDNETEDFKFPLASSYKYVLEHPYIIKSYRPFLSSDYAQSGIEIFVQNVLIKYPKLDILIKPFISKLLLNLQTFPKHLIESTDFVSHIRLYISHSILKSEDIQRLILSCLNLEDCESVTKFLTYLLELSVTCPNLIVLSLPDNATKLLFDRLLLYNSLTSQVEESSCKLLSRILSKSIDDKLATSITTDELKELVNGKFFFADLYCQLICLHASHASIITKQLKKNNVDLATQIPYILAHLKLECDNKNILTYLSRIREAILQWSLSVDSEANELYEKLLEHMLQKNMFDISELRNICNHWYEQVTQLKVIPPHILNLSPIYNFVSKVENNLQDQDHSSPNLQFLCINISIVSKFYGKEKDSSIFLKLSSNILKLTTELDSSCIKSEIESSSKIWSNFVKKILKKGLTDMLCGQHLLTCLAALIKIVYNEPKNQLMMPLFSIMKMLLFHSQFFSALLSQSVIKEKIVNLIKTIIKIDPQGCEEGHVPLFLGGYNATRSSADQAILKVLFWYERNGYMPTYNPVIWGKSAISHFAIEKGPGNKHHYKNPRHQDIFALLDKDKVLRTAKMFDMQLKLEPTVTISCDSDIYDQRFLLMVFLNVTEEDATMNIMEMISKGVVAMGIAALSSHCEEVWAAGSTILKNIVIHLEQSGYLNLKLQWMWLIGVLGYGLENKRARLPSINVHFLINASELLQNPDDIMYKVVLNYLYLKPSFSISKIPEFYVLYFSDSTELHREHRSFLLSLLSSGIRDELDVQLCHHAFIPKYMMGLLTSPTATFNIKMQALLVLKSLVSIQEGTLCLVYEYGLLAQLPAALQPSTLCASDNNIRDLVKTVLDVLITLWKTVNQKENISIQDVNIKSRTDKVNEFNKNNKRPLLCSNSSDDRILPFKKLKTFQGSLPIFSNGIIMKKYSKTEKWLVTEYVSSLKNISKVIFLYGSPECNSSYSDFCQELGISSPS